VAAHTDHVVMLCGPRGRAAAELLPGVDELIEWRVPWIDPEPGPVERSDLDRFAGIDVDEAVLFTSYHQSPLPLALLLRAAGVPRISAISVDYPGSLLDVRHRVPDGIPEPERALSLAAAAGFPPASDDDLRLRVDVPAAPSDGSVVVHPGTSVTPRACPPERCRQIVVKLAAAGYRVRVTGAPHETALTAYVAGTEAEDLGGRTTLRELARVLSAASCVVVANTGPAHLAAAVGTPVVSLFAPTVPFGQWAPFRVPLVGLGVPAGLSTLDASAVAEAVAVLRGRA
jgi:hypothetical protein